MRNKAIIIATVIVLLATGGVYLKRQDIKQAFERYQRGPIPEETAKEDVVTTVSDSNTNETIPTETEPAPVTKPEVTPVTEPVTAPVTKPEAAKPVPAKPTPSPAVEAGTIPAQMNLKVPFIPQAPFKIWDAVHEDACEEASALMLQAYTNGEKSLTLEEMDRRIMGLADYLVEKYGSYKDSDAAMTAEFMRDFLGLPGAKALPIKTADDIRRHIAAGRPVMVPAAGKLLMNPNFRHGGPLYHMLVIKGYRSDGSFITNDPGTRVGENYVYSEETIMNALHDFNGGDVENGARVIIVVEE